MNNGLIPIPPRCIVEQRPDGTIQRRWVDRWIIAGTTSFAPEAHTPVRPLGVR